MNIRVATAADIPTIMRLERECSTTAHWSEQQYLQMVRPGGSERLILVAEAAGVGPSVDIVAFLVAHQIAPEWELENLVVAPAARRTGLGTRLLQTLSDHAQQTNSESVFLEVRESNATARALYEKARFEQTGCRKSYYSNPLEDAILYRRHLR